MSVIRRLAPKTCPDCGASDSLFIDMDRRLTCRLCGYKAQEAASSGNPETPNTTQVIRPEDRDLRPQYNITHRGEVNVWAKAAYTTGQDAIRQKNYPEALKAFQRALESERDFTDAHLWIARLSTDPAVKRDHIENVLVLEPTHKDAMIELMLLEGRLTPQQAQRIESFDDPILKEAMAPVATQAKEIRCPICGGEDYLLEDDGEIQCYTCGYLGEPDIAEEERGYGLESLTMALLERRGKEIVWVVGEHLLVCESCGAERTITRKMSQRCPFCGSNQVIERDALDSFRQPDGVIPFKLDEDQAQEAVRAAVNTGLEKIKGWFINNRIKQTMTNGIYVPYWLFDFVLQVSKTITDKRSASRYAPAASASMSYRNETVPDMMNNLPIPAVTSPPKRLLNRLGRFDHRAIVDYVPEVLARHSAAIYSIDFDKASLDARTIVSRAMREEHGQSHDSDVQITVMSNVQNVMFRLVLVPIWVVTIIEEDEDVRLALVNGQTGTVALGRAEKRR